MSAPNIPGLAQHPELEKKFKTKWAALGRQRGGRCPKCRRSRLIQVTRQEILHRQRRDKKP